MEMNEISLHLLKVFEAARSHAGWLTAKEIADRSGVAARTARAHASRLVSLGIFDIAEVFPAHRYRFSALAEKRNKAMFQRLENARVVFGDGVC
jgi:DNA-binding IclR family transcriptional regulator